MKRAEISRSWYDNARAVHNKIFVLNKEILINSRILCYTAYLFITRCKAGQLTTTTPGPKHTYDKIEGKDWFSATSTLLEPVSSGELAFNRCASAKNPKIEQVPRRKGLYLSICICNCQGLSRYEHTWLLLRRIGTSRTSRDILGISETLNGRRWTQTGLLRAQIYLEQEQVYRTLKELDSMWRRNGHEI